MAVIESDNDNNASCVELTGAEDEQASDWLGLDNQPASEGEEPHAEEEATPCSKAQPIPHHALHAHAIVHTLVSPETPDKGADDL